MIGKNVSDKLHYPDDFVKSYTYDCCRLSSVVDRNGTTTLEYNDINRLTSATDIYGKTISYAYDYAGNLTSLTYPGNKVVTYAYDPANRLTSVTDWLDNTTTYDYSLGGNMMKVVYPDGSILVHQFDDADRLTAIWDFKADATVDASFEFSLNSLGNRTGISYHQPLNAVPPTQSVTNTFGNDNRMLTLGSTTFDFDNSGNVITRTVGSDVTTYSWNYDNMLAQVVSGSNTYSYTYDGLGNRVAKVENSTTTRYVVEPRSSTVLAETDASGNITAYYVYGLGLISKITPSDETYYYHYDGLGNIVAMTDSAGSVVNKYSYDAYGKVLSQVEAVSNPFKYVGLFGVIDEGNGLLYMRARYYDTAMRRFLNKDPIGFLGGDLNLYAYVRGNPVNWVDPWGLYLTISQQINVTLFSSIGSTAGFLIGGALGSPTSGSAIGGAVGGAMAARFMGGSFQDVANAFFTGGLSGLIGAGIGNLLEDTLMHGMQAAMITGTVSGLYNVIFMGAEQPLKESCD